MRALLCAAFVLVADALVLRVSHGATPRTLRNLAHVFEPLDYTSRRVEAITVYPSPGSKNRVNVTSHFLFDDGGDAWVNGSGNGLPRACNDCVLRVLLGQTDYIFYV